MYERLLFSVDVRTSGFKAHGKKGAVLYGARARARRKTADDGRRPDAPGSIRSGAAGRTCISDVSGVRPTPARLCVAMASPRPTPGGSLISRSLPPAGSVVFAGPNRRHRPSLLRFLVLSALPLGDWLVRALATRCPGCDIVLSQQY